MCDIQYFRRAYHKLVVAKEMMTKFSRDELFITDVEYYAQQCVKFTLKAFLESAGNTVPDTHSITKLVAMTDSNESACKLTDWIRQNAYMLTAWEAESRYDFDYHVELEVIKEALVEIEKFLMINGLHMSLEKEITESVKDDLRKILPKRVVPADDFEWNCYYHIFQKKLNKLKNSHNKEVHNANAF